MPVFPIQAEIFDICLIVCKLVLDAFLEWIEVHVIQQLLNCRIVHGGRSFRSVGLIGLDWIGVESVASIRTIARLLRKFYDAARHRGAGRSSVERMVVGFHHKFRKVRYTLLLPYYCTHPPATHYQHADAHRRSWVSEYLL
jgi:hypothetical protein